MPRPRKETLPPPLDGPEMEVTTDAAEGHENGGSTRETYIPSNADLIVQPDSGSSRFEAVREMMHGSADPVEYLPRTILTEREIALDLRIQNKVMALQGGAGNFEVLQAWKYNARPAVAGYRMKQVVQVAVQDARQQRIPEYWSRTRQLNGGSKAPGD